MLYDEGIFILKRRYTAFQFCPVTRKRWILFQWNNDDDDIMDGIATIIKYYNRRKNFCKTGIFIIKRKFQ